MLALTLWEQHQLTCLETLQTQITNTDTFSDPDISNNRTNHK